MHIKNDPLKDYDITCMTYKIWICHLIFVYLEMGGFSMAQKTSGGCVINHSVVTTTWTSARPAARAVWLQVDWDPPPGRWLILDKRTTSRKKRTWRHYQSVAVMLLTCYFGPPSWDSLLLRGTTHFLWACVGSVHKLVPNTFPHLYFIALCFAILK